MRTLEQVKPSLPACVPEMALERTDTIQLVGATFGGDTVRLYFQSRLSESSWIHVALSECNGSGSLPELAARWIERAHAAPRTEGDPLLCERA